MKRILVLGDLNLDVFVRDDTEVAEGAEVRSVVRAQAGGSAGTFARFAAAHGAEVAFIGTVGEDRVGDLLERSLVDAGVIPHLARSSMPSGVIVALHRGSERSMICSRGANDDTSVEAIEPELLEAADHLHVSGYALLSEAQWPAVTRAFALAARGNASLSVDPPPANLIEAFGVARFLDRIPESCWLFPNETEGRILTGETAHDRIVTRLAIRSEAGALTLGASGSLAWHGDERHAQTTSPLESVDTTGAGDAFAGAFVASFVALADLTEAHRRAGNAARTRLLQGSASRPERP